MSAQIVLITGCSKGIGQETALYLAKDPQRRFKVYATMRNLDTTRHDQLKIAAGNDFEDTLFIRELDVTKQNTIDETVKDIVANEGRIDVLVNNAGIVSPEWWETGTMEPFLDIMDANYFGCVRTTKAVVPHMKENQCGRIIQISSLLGFNVLPILAQYTGSKFALEGFSESIAPPLRNFNIWVSVIQLGVTLTPIIPKGITTPGDVCEFYAKHVPGKDGEIVKRMITSDPSIALGTETQSAADIAQLVRDVITSSKPDFRYQPSETGKRFARLRLVDPSGNETMDTWLKQLSTNHSRFLKVLKNKTSKKWT